MIKQEFEQAHILDGKSIQQFIDEFAGIYGRNEHMQGQLTEVDDRF